MLLVAAAVGGIVVVFCGYVGYRLGSNTYILLAGEDTQDSGHNIQSSDGFICSQVRRYVFKIQDPKNNFRMDKKVKCRDGNKKIQHFYMNFLRFLFCLDRKTR